MILDDALLISTRVIASVRSALRAKSYDESKVTKVEQRAENYMFMMYNA